MRFYLTSNTRLLRDTNKMRLPIETSILENDEKRIEGYEMRMNLKYVHGLYNFWCHIAELFQKASDEFALRQLAENIIQFMQSFYQMEATLDN